jgi:hypothetical protein
MFNSATHISSMIYGAIIASLRWRRHTLIFAVSSCVVSHTLGKTFVLIHMSPSHLWSEAIWSRREKTVTCLRQEMALLSEPSVVDAKASSAP